MRRADTNRTFILSAPTLDSQRTETKGPMLDFADSCSVGSAKVKHYASLVWGDRLRFMGGFAKDADLGLGILSGAARLSFPVRGPDVTFFCDARQFLAVRASLNRWQWRLQLGKNPSVFAIFKVTYCMFRWIRPLLAKIARCSDASAARASSKKI